MSTKFFCKITGCVVLFLGILGSFFWAKESGMVMGFLRPERDWGLTITIFLTGVVVVSMAAVVLLGIAKIIENQEDTKYFLKTLTEKLDHQNRAMDSAQTLWGEEKKDGWKCSNCGKINANYVGTCACGNTKP